jgi:dihydroorotase/N-acyl-D-amino-acid deacylase
MKDLVSQAMRDGAVGVSTALEYAPAPYAKTEELIALAAEASRFGGIYATHMRNEGTGVLPAIDEALRIGREAHVPVEIWHLKTGGKPSWGHMPEVVAKINAARAQGLDVSADTYAYTAWFNDFSAFIPAWAHDGGNAKLIERLKDPATRERIRKDMLTPSDLWDNEWQEIPGPEAVLIGVVHNPQLLPLQGKTLAEIAKIWNKDPMDALFDLLIEDHALTWPSSACPSRTLPSRSSNPGSPSITIPPALRPTASLVRNILIRAPTARSLASCANTSAKSTSSPSKTPYANSPLCLRNACALRTAAS